MPKSREPADAGEDAKVDRSTDRDARGAEIRAFLFLTVVLAPLVAVVVVGGYGFVIWIYQLLAGPPAS